MLRNIIVFYLIISISPTNCILYWLFDCISIYMRNRSIFHAKLLGRRILSVRYGIYLSFIHHFNTISRNFYITFILNVWLWDIFHCKWSRIMIIRNRAFFLIFDSLSLAIYFILNKSFAFKNLLSFWMMILHFIIGTLTWIMINWVIFI